MYFPSESIFEGFYHRLVTFGLEHFGKFYGFYRGKVDSLVDDEQGKIRVVVPRVSDRPLPPARPLVFWAQGGYGAFFPPDVGEIVTVMFEDGDPARPWWIGGYYAADELPSDLRLAGKDRYGIRGLVSKAFLKLLFDETDEASPSLRLEHPSGAKVILGKNRVTVETGSGISATFDSSSGADVVTIGTSGGAKLVLDGAGAKLSAPEGVVVGAGAGEPMVLGTKLAALLGSLLDAVATVTVVSSAPGSPTSPPVNAAQFVALRGQVEALKSTTNKVV